ncbi:MAG: cytochrome d ubiquinol oxidase subunit II [Chlamydiia bacterium]|nr:cytochrome d ubiquinol oxidase subunit II [Chlamydiia bacterium]
MLESIWYAVIGIAAIFYVVLDGFDLGVGAFHLLAKDDLQRRHFLNAIGPVWDGNEVWLIIVVGGLFAGFPNVYATLFSGFYTLFMILIAALIFRAVAIEFRSKRESTLWRSIWDILFSFASILVAFLLGVLIGNMVEGIPLDAEQNYIGTLSDIFKPYPILIGITAISLFAMHGSLFLVMKTEGKTHNLVRKWIHPAIYVFLFFVSLATLATWLYAPHMVERFYRFPALFVFPLLALGAIANVFIQVKKKNDGWAFISSSLCLILLFFFYGIGTYPIIVSSTLLPDTHSLTIYNSASTQTTLKNLLTVAVIGVPLVLGYGFWVYRIFSGKVKLDHSSY